MYKNIVMYKKLLFFVGVLLLLSSCTNNYTIEGTVDKMADGAKVLLRKQVNESFVDLDSTFVKNGNINNIIEIAKIM